MVQNRHVVAKSPYGFPRGYQGTTFVLSRMIIKSNIIVNNHPFGATTMPSYLEFRYRLQPLARYYGV